MPSTATAIPTCKSLPPCSSSSMAAQQQSRRRRRQQACLMLWGRGRLRAVLCASSQVRACGPSPAAAVPPSRGLQAMQHGRAVSSRRHDPGPRPAWPVMLLVDFLPHSLPPQTRAGTIAADCGGSDFRWAGGWAAQSVPAADAPARDDCSTPGVTAALPTRTPTRWLTAQHSCPCLPS